jgi:hypothetical protein
MEIIEYKPVKLACPTDERCSDYDEDCAEVKNKTLCWLYQPELGTCPYLKGEASADH